MSQDKYKTNLFNNFVVHVFDNDLLKHENCKEFFKELFFWLNSSTQKHLKSPFSSIFWTHDYFMERYVSSNRKFKIYFDKITDNNPVLGSVACDFLRGTYVFKPLTYSIDFYNETCYDSFLTVERIRTYILWVIGVGEKQGLHLTNMLSILCGFTQDIIFQNLYTYTIHQMKTVGVCGKYHSKSSRENTHNVLSSYPPYKTHVDEFYQKRMVEFVYVCDEIYKNYDCNELGNRIAVDEIIVRTIVKFMR